MSDLLHNAHIFLQNVGLRDVIDVAVVAFLLYQLLKLIRGTQAVQLLLGLGVVFIAGFGSTQFHLRLLEFIFANGSQAIIVAAVVLFQPELRRALDQVGRLNPVRSVLGRHGDLAIVRTVEEVINAAGRLSERKQGGLIVFEHGTGLENVAGTGVRIDGAVTAELLVALFFPNSPLHDGAVVVRENRIIAAGCVLPLADALPGVGRMGTRHRAALGLTLQSDAVILIVSEETGLISLAHQGKIFRGLERNKLRDMLVTLLGGAAPGGRAFIPRPFVRSAAAVRAANRRAKLPGFATRNLRLKALAALLALITWVGVVYAGNPPETRTVSVRVPQDPSLLPAGFVLLDHIPDVAIRVSGTKDHLDAFDPATLSVRANWKAITTAGTQSLPLTVTNNDRDVELDQPPASVSASVDRLDTATVKVSIDAKPPPANYVIRSQVVTPQQVTLEGPHSQLAHITAVAQLDLSNWKTNVIQDVPVVLLQAGRQVGSLSVTPTTVRVTITIELNQVSRTSAVTPTFNGAVPSGYQLTAVACSPPTVVINGPSDLLSGIDSVPTDPIDLTGLRSGRSVTVHVKLPAGVTASPDQVGVSLTITFIVIATPVPTAAPPTATPAPSPSAT